MSNDKVKPIRPEEIEANLEKIIPDYVFKAVNELLEAKYRGTGSVTIKQKVIVDKILSENEGVTKRFLYDNNYMDFEPVYREYGWKVVYDRLGYNESYDAIFEFSKK